jgi:hypothetical protein
MPEPADSADGVPRATVWKWEKKIDEFVKRELALEENLRTLYTLVWGQCTETMWARVEPVAKKKDMSDELDALALLKTFKSIAYNFQSQKYKWNALNDSKRRLYVLVKGRFVTCQVPLGRFQNCIDVFQHCGGSFGNEPAIVNEVLIAGGIDLDAVMQEEIAAAITVAQEQCIASLFLQGADRGRYGKLIEDLENAFTQGRDDYPKSM